MTPGKLPVLFPAETLRTIESENDNDANTLVHTCMTSDIITVTPETSLEKAEKA